MPRFPLRVGPIWLLVAALLSLYLATLSTRFHSIDEISIFATADSLVRGEGGAVESLRWTERWTPVQNRQGTDGRYYPKRGLGPALPFVPWVGLARGLPTLGPVQGALLGSALLSAASAGLLAASLQRMGFRQRTALLVAATWGIATPAWPYAKTIYDVVPTTFCWLLAFWALLRARERPGWALLGGTALAASLLLKPTNALGVGCFALWALWRARRRGGRWQPLVPTLLALALPMLAAALLLAWQNWQWFGSALASGYGAEAGLWRWPSVESVLGLLISPGRGLLIFAPPLWAALWGARRFAKRHRDVAALLLALLVSNVALYSAWYIWWGGWTWGPRFLLPLLPFALLPMASLLEQRAPSWQRRRLAALVLLGLLLNALGALVDFNAVLVSLAAAGIAEPDRATLWDLRLWPPLGHVALLRAGTVDLVWAGRATIWVSALLALLAAVAGAEASGPRPPRTAAPQAVVVALAALALLFWALPRTLRAPQALALDALSHEIAANAGRNDAVLVDLVAYQPYFDTIQQWMSLYEAPPPYTAAIRGETPDAVYERLLTHEPLWLVLPGTPPGDPASSTEQWFAERSAFLDERWAGDARVVRVVPFASEPVLSERQRLGGVVAVEASAPRVQGGLALVTLRWQALRPLQRELRVFVQLVDAQGQAVALHDRAPQGGLRPMTTWEPGDPLVDGYALPIPPEGGPFRVVVGLYDPASGERLRTPDGRDALLVGDVP